MEKIDSYDRFWNAEFEGTAKLIYMPKLRDCAEMVPNILFLEFDFYDYYGFV